MKNMKKPDDRLMARDPIVAYVMANRGVDWHPELESCIELPADTPNKIPEVYLSTLDHKVEWPYANVTFIQKWIAPEKCWRTTLHIPAVPEQISIALVGKRGSEIIDAPGADAWVVDNVREVSGGELILTMKRIAS